MKNLKNTILLSLTIFLASFSCSENNKKEVNDDANTKTEAFEIKKRNLIDEINQALAEVEKELIKAADDKSLERKLKRSKNRLENSLEKLAKTTEDSWEEVSADVNDAVDEVDDAMKDVSDELNNLSKELKNTFKKD